MESNQHSLIEIKSIKDLYLLKDRFRADGLPVNPNWIMDRSMQLKSNIQYGFSTFYSDGYFINKKIYLPFNN